MDARTGYRAHRVHSILMSFLDRVERARRPHPELLDMLAFAVDRFMELAYGLNALESCLAASRMGLVAQEMIAGTGSPADPKARLVTLREELAAAWQREAPQPGEGPSASPAAPPAAASPVPAPPGGDADAGKPAGAPAGQEPGSFHYVGGEATPYDPELSEAFLEEAAEQSAQAEQMVLGLEERGHDVWSVNELFRTLHTLKGNAGFLGLQEFVALLHAMEQYLEPLRVAGARGRVDSDLLLAGVDAVQRLLRNFAARCEALRHDAGAHEWEPVDWQGLADRFSRTAAA